MGTALLSAIVALVVVLLTGRVNAARAHDDRIWARKAAAYSTILEALHDLDAVYDEWIGDIVDGQIASEETSEQRAKDYWDAKRAMLSATSREVWILPRAMEDEIRTLRQALDTNHDSWDLTVRMGSDAIAEARLRIAAFARQEMDRPSWLERLQRCGHPSPPPPTT